MYVMSVCVCVHVCTCMCLYMCSMYMYESVCLRVSGAAGLSQTGSHLQ